MQPRPGWLTTLSIIAICLGGLGFLAATFGAVQLLVGEKFQAAIMQAQQFGGNNAMMEQQMKMREEIQAVPILQSMRPTAGACRRLGLHQQA